MLRAACTVRAIRHKAAKHFQHIWIFSRPMQQLPLQPEWINSLPHNESLARYASTTTAELTLHIVKIWNHEQNNSHGQKIPAYA